MNLSKTSIKGLGTLVSAVLLLTTGLAVINPIMDQRSQGKEELQSLQKITETKKANLERLTNGAVNYEEAFNVGNNFKKIVPKDKNIESASRAISEALVPGVSITSFNFATEQPATKHKLPAVSLAPYTPPAGFAAQDGKPAAPAAPASDSDATGTPGQAAAPKGTLNRLPMTVNVSADNYQALASYVDQLSTRNRLLSVISVTAASKEGKVKADIYVYAFIDKTK